ncbi:MAG TPA: hypothetical protein VNH65_07940 [Candidatus Acidoferrum sp.]|nr:hypothetical protein [Candidatus Acidoferrum sp.]
MTEHSPELLVFEGKKCVGMIDASYGFKCGGQITTVEPPMEVRCRNHALEEGLIW